MHRLRSSNLIWLLVLATFLVPVSVRAQDAEAGGSDFGLFGGYFLPNQIDRVTEILPLFGGRYAMTFPGGAIEFELENAHAYGIDWTNFGVSFRGEIPVAQGLSGLIYAGPDLRYYAPAGETSRSTDYGLHVGAGALLLIKDSLWLRTDLKFMGNPGTGLYILFGLMFRPAAGQQ